MVTVSATDGSLSDTGRVRSDNQDCLGKFPEGTDALSVAKGQLFIVADGMGGHAAGEVASSIAVHEIRDAVNNNRDLIDRYRVDHPGVQAYEILQRASAAMPAVSRSSASIQSCAPSSRPCCASIARRSRCSTRGAATG